MTPEFLNSIVAVVLSLAFSFVPKLREWYNKFDEAGKQIVMIGLLALAAIVITGLSCTALADYMSIAVPCNADGIVMAIRAFGLAVLFNQGFYSITNYIAQKMEK